MHMAYLITTDGKKLCISTKVGLFLWISLLNPDNIDSETTTKLQKISDIYLNWRTAPDDYIQNKLESIIPIALLDWFVDRHGIPTKPQSDHAWTFAKRWGLWENGAPSYLVTGASAPVVQLPFAD